MNIFDKAKKIQPKPKKQYHIHQWNRNPKLSFIEWLKINNRKTS